LSAVICNESVTCNEHKCKFTLGLNELGTHLLARGYSNSFLIDSQFKRAANSSCPDALNSNRHDSINRLLFVVTYYPYHFLTFIISYVNILTYYFPPTAAANFLNTHPSSPADALLTFVTFQFKLNYPLSRLLITLVYNPPHFAVDKIKLLVLTSLTVLDNTLSSPQVQPVTPLHT